MTDLIFRVLIVSRSVPALAGLLLLGIGAAVAENPGDAALRFDDVPAERTINHPDWFKLSFLDLRQDLAETKAAGKQGLIVYFGQENCPYCEALMEVNFTQPDIVWYTKTHFDVVALNIWGQQLVTDLNGVQLSEEALAVREKTNLTPAMVFYTVDGKEALRLRGYYPPYLFRAALEYVADRHYRKEGFRDYVARANPPAKFEKTDLNERDFFSPPPIALDRSRVPSQRPLAVFFEQSECHACDILHTDPLSDPRALRYMRKIDAVQLNMWEKTPVITPSGQRTNAHDWSAKLGLFYAPALVFFDERGKEILRLDSVVRLYRLSRVLEYIAERGYQSVLNYQQWHGRPTIDAARQHHEGSQPKQSKISPVSK